MSVLFPKVNKAPTWDWRPIYYDPKKDEMDRKLRELQARRKAEEAAKQEAEGQQDGAVKATAASDDYAPTLHRGSFREQRESAMSIRQKANRQSKLVLWIILLGLLVFSIYYLL